MGNSGRREIELVSLLETAQGDAAAQGNTTSLDCIQFGIMSVQDRAPLGWGNTCEISPPRAGSRLGKSQRLRS